MKKISAILLAVMLVFCSMSVSVFADNGLQQSVGIDLNTSMTTIVAGDERIVDLKLSPLTKDQYKLVYECKTDGIEVQSNSGILTDETHANFTLFIGKNVPSGTFNVKAMAVDPTDQTKVFSSRIFTFYVAEVKDFDWSSDPTASCEIAYEVEGGSIQAGKTNTVKFILLNKGDCYVSNTVLKLDSIPSGISLKSGGNTKNVGAFPIGGMITSNFDLDCPKTVANGSYPFTVSYNGKAAGKDVGTAVTIYIPVTGGGETEPDKPDDSDVGNPILMVTGYDFGGEAVKAGEDFTLNLTFTNTSVKSAVSNIKATISAGGTTFIANGTSNGLFIPKIGRGASVEKSIPLTCLKEAPQGPASVSISMSYEDENGMTHSSSDTISIPVIQVIRFKVDEILDPGYLTADSQGWVSVNYYNMSQGQIYNLTITAEGDFTIDGNQSTYVGNMAAGRSDYYSFSFFPNGEGMCHGTVTFSFEDVAGNPQVVEKEFNFNIGPAYVWEDDPGMWEDPVVEPGFHIQTWMYIVAGVVVVAVIIIIVAVSKKKREKKHQELELDD